VNKIDRRQSKNNNAHITIMIVKRVACNLWSEFSLSALTASSGMSSTSKSTRMEGSDNGDLRRLCKYSNISMSLRCIWLPGLDELEGEERGVDAKQLA
jgi:hypothetical protein